VGPGDSALKGEPYRENKKKAFWNAEAGGGILGTGEESWCQDRS